MANQNYIAALYATPVIVEGKRGSGPQTNIRTVGGDAICTTAYSYKLDEDLSGVGWKTYEGREEVAARVMLAWNACLGLSNEELNRMAIDRLAHLRGEG